MYCRYKFKLLRLNVMHLTEMRTKITKLCIVSYYAVKLPRFKDKAVYCKLLRSKTAALQGQSCVL